MAEVRLINNIKGILYYLVESIAVKGYSLEAVVLVAIHCVPSKYYEKILKDIGIGGG